MKYDYLIVGAGLYGATIAHEAKKAGKSVLVIDRRPNIAGNVYTEDIEHIHVHKYGAHIFHTNDRGVWDFVNQFAVFNRFTNSPVANFHGELFSLPFNMYTFNKMWGVVTPEEAAAKIEEQRKAAGITTPKNLEEQAISLVGTDIYEKLIKGYTEKQWGRKCTELPAFITNKLWVFGSKNMSAKIILNELWKFITARLTVGLIDLAIMYIAVDVCHGPAVIFKFVAATVTIILNFVLSKLVVFRKAKQVKKQEPANEV